MKKLLIAFEGLPGSGKTTIAKAAAEYYHGNFMEEIVKNKKFLPDQDEYYIESELLKLKKFSKSKKMLNFFDRSFYSMMAYNYGRKMVGLSDIMESLGPYLLGTKKPDLFVYLRIDDVTLCNKRKNRGVNNSDVWTREDSLIHIKNFYDDFFSNEQNLITIETDNRSLDEIRLLLIHEIEKHV